MRVLVTGASGSGTTTLGGALAHRLDWPHFDADRYYWLPTTPAFTFKRDRSERLRLLHDDLDRASSAIVSGCVSEWGHELENGFSLIVFLTVPAAIRVERLQKRELALLGHANPEFLEWAAQYDEGRLSGRSLARHEQWLSERSCPILRIAGEVELADSCGQALRAVANLPAKSNTAATAR